MCVGVGGGIKKRWDGDTYDNMREEILCSTGSPAARGERARYHRFTVHQFATAVKEEVRPTLGRQWLRPLTTDRQPCGEQLTQKPLAEHPRTPMSRPTSHSHLTKRPAVARATAGKVLARGCTRQGQSTRRGLSSSPTKWNTSTTWSVDRASWLISSSSWQRGCHLRPSRPGWP